VELEELGQRLKIMPSIWMAPDEYPVMMKYAGLADSPIVEIGTAFGGSACILVLCSSQNVTSIDPFVEPLCNVDGYKIRPDDVRSKIRQVLGPDFGRITLWQVTSKFAAEYYAEWGVDKRGLVYIDGCHDYDFVRQDVDLWLPLIKSGGYLLLHDSQRNDAGLCGDEGPTRVAQELMLDDRVEFLEGVYSLTVWRKL
jgi:cephalosporin hydroxylase